MSGRVAMQSRFRQRRAAIGRKSTFEMDFLMAESDLEDDAVASARGKAPVSVPLSSPKSVFHMMPEITPISLPEAWTVIGKGGKKLKNVKMYDEPKKQAKKRRPRPRTAAREEDKTQLDTLAEAASSSRCLEKLDRSTAQHSNQVTRGRDAKKWVHYRKAKKAKQDAHSSLLALMCSDEPERVERSMKQTNHKGRFANSHTEKTRRKARFAHAAERCYWPKMEDETMPTLPTQQPRPKLKSGSVDVHQPQAADHSATQSEWTLIEGMSCVAARVKDKVKQSTCSVM